MSRECTCSACGLPCADARKCGMCAQRRSPDPAYYCSKACAKQHWKASHRAWHDIEKHEMDFSHSVNPHIEGSDAERKLLRGAEAAEALGDKAQRLVARAFIAINRRDNREAAKLASKAVELEPKSPSAHFVLGAAHEFHDDEKAATYHMRAMTLSDPWRNVEKFAADPGMWAQAATRAHMCLARREQLRMFPFEGQPPSCWSRTSEPEWFTNSKQRKLTADRAALILAGTEEEVETLLVRATAYDSPGASAADLRVAIRDMRRAIQLCGGTAGQAKLLEDLEERLRTRIKADVAAAR